MQRLLATKTVSMVDMREPGKVLAEANGEPVAVLKNNRCVGYFVPAERVGDEADGYAASADVMSAFEAERARIAPALDYLKDK